MAPGITCSSSRTRCETVHQEFNDLRFALERHSANLPAAIRTNDQEGIQDAYCGIMNAHLLLENYEEAKEYFAKYLEAKGHQPDPEDIEKGLYCSVGDAFYEKKAYAMALHYYMHYSKIVEELDDQKSMNGAYYKIGEVHHTLKSYDIALEYYEKYLESAKKLVDQEGMKRAYCCLGEVYSSLNQHQKTIECFHSYIRIRNNSDDLVTLGQAYCFISNAYKRLGDRSSAKKYQQLASQIAQQTNHSLNITYV